MSISTNKPLVIVTGSSGYIGSAVITALASDYQLVGFDREAAPHPPAVAECVCIDLTKEKSLETALERVKTVHGKSIASVIHLAAYFDLSGEPSDAYEQITLGGTRRLLECLQPFDVEQFVFVSTMLVHAPNESGEAINESSPIDPKLPYRESKALTEQIVKEQAGDIPVVILRPAGIYDEECHSAFLAEQISGIYEQRYISHFYPGELSVGQPYLHLRDLTNAIHRTIDMRAELSRETVMLLAEPEVLGYGELQRLIGSLLHSEEWVTISVPPELAYAGTWTQEALLGEDQFQKPWMVSIANDHYEVDCSRAQEIIGWSPSHRLSKVLPAIIQNLNNDPYSWYRVNGLNPARVAHDKTLTADMDEDNAPKDPVQARAEEREHTKSMEKMHFNNLWVHFATMMLGLWLASAPLVLGTFTTNEFSDLVQQVTIDRGLWEPELRNRLTAWNDVIVGALMMIFSCFSLTRRGGLAQWSNACLGVWLLFAPILFWTPSAAVYLNHTLVGALAIAFTILIPMMPGMSQESMMDPSEVPPGWSYSPSSYLQRVPMIALGLIGFVLARILAAYQLGHVDWVWEPFFIGNIERNGSELIITSEISKAWPIADGGLGAITYMFEVLMGIMGGRARWRTMPWMVVLFGIAVVPLGVISIYFIIIQPIMIGTYCTLCLITALGMLIMIPFALDELVAMGQFLLLNTRRGQPFWRAFFRGGALPGGTKDKRAGFSDSIGQSYLSAVRGVNVPWTLAASTVLGLWLMFSRLAFGTEGDLANSDHLVGALVITTAIISMAEVARPARLFNLLLGVWLVVAPWVLSGGQIDGQLSTTLCGTLLLALSLPRGHRSSEHYGEWDRYIV